MNLEKKAEYLTRTKTLSELKAYATTINLEVTEDKRLKKNWAMAIAHYEAMHPDTEQTLPKIVQIKVGMRKNCYGEIIKTQFTNGINGIKEYLINFKDRNNYWYFGREFIFCPEKTSLSLEQKKKIELIQIEKFKPNWKQTITKNIAAHFSVDCSQLTKIEEWHNVLLVMVKGIGTRFVSKTIAFKNASASIFNRLIKSHVSDWNIWDLKLLRSIELQSLCLLLGCPKSGNKQQIIARLKTILHVRLIVTPFAKKENLDRWEQAKLIAQNFKYKQLKHLCKMVRTYAPTNKLGMGNALLTWLFNSIARGKRAYEDAISMIKTQPA